MNQAQIIGVTVSETTAETTTAITSVTANSWNSSPMMPGMKTIGENTATSDRVIDITVKPICPAPRKAARNGGMPRSTWAWMFSIMTIASSTTKPTEMVIASSEKLSIVKPSNHMPASVPAIESGMVTPAAMVSTVRCRKTITTASTSSTVMSSVNCTSSTLARIVVVRSVSVVTWMPLGISFMICGMSFCTPSTVWMTLAPGSLVMSSRMAGFCPLQAASRSVATLSMTFPRSRRCSTPSVPVAITRLPYCFAVVIWPLTSSVSAWSGPSMLPIGWMTFAFPMLWLIDSADSFASATEVGSSCTRTAGLSAPISLTSATPVAWDSRCARMVSTAS